MADLEGARYGYAMASGCVGATTIVHLLSTGDHVVACDDMYGGTFRLFDKVFARQGIQFSYVDLADPSALESALQPSTKLLWLETPTNPLLKIMDIAALADIAHARGVHVAVDNTFMSPYFQQPLALGAGAVSVDDTTHAGLAK